MDVIHDTRDAAVHHVETDGPSWSKTTCFFTQHDNDRGLAIHFALCQLPRHRPALVVAEIGRFDYDASESVRHAQLCVDGDNLEPRPNRVD